MEGLIGMIGAAAGGVIVGFILAKAMGGTTKSAPEQTAEVEWWKIRETLTGTQLQILQYMEGNKSATITQLQEKFSFIPDRELYYRLEQIVLMQFLTRGRNNSDVVYELNTDYSATIEDDKTVMLSGD